MIKYFLYNDILNKPQNLFAGLCLSKVSHAENWASPINYSILKLSAGFVSAALYVCDIIVNNPTASKNKKHITTLINPKCVRSLKFCRNITESNEPIGIAINPATGIIKKRLSPRVFLYS